MENLNCTGFSTDLKPLYICSEGQYMNAHEKFEIYKLYNNSDTKPHVFNDQLQSLITENVAMAQQLNIKHK